MPSIFCLDRNTEETIAFLAKMRDDLLKKATDLKERMRRKQKLTPIKMKHFYDMSTVKYMSPTTALILAAIYDRIKNITGQKLHTVNERRWDPSVSAMLHSVGFHEFLELRNNKPDDTKDSPVIVQKFVSGTLADGKPLGILQEVVADLLPDQQRERLLDVSPYGGMLEAILNSHSWAYPDGHTWEYPPLKRWWLTGSVDRKEGRVIVIAYDQGVSIPHSLPRWKHWPTFAHRFQRLLTRLRIAKPMEDTSNDGIAIRLAMKIAKTKTHLPQHGKGLHTMFEVADRARHGRLRIISRNGQFEWETGKPATDVTYAQSIGGTLVEWTLDL